MNVPGTAKGIIECVRQDYKLSIQTIAYQIKVVPKTIYQILNSKTPYPITDFQLLCFYLKLKLQPKLILQPIKKNEKNCLFYVNSKNFNTAISIWG